MRHPLPVGLITMNVHGVREVTRRDSDEVWAHELSGTTEPNGGNARVLASVDDHRAEDLRELIGQQVTLECSLGARADGRDGVRRGYLSANLGRVLPESVTSALLTPA